jgi:hypothetical protein
VCVGFLGRERERERNVFFWSVYFGDKCVCVGWRGERERERERETYCCVCVECELYVGKTTTAITTHRFFAPHTDRQQLLSLSSLELLSLPPHAPRAKKGHTHRRSSHTHTFYTYIYIMMFTRLRSCSSSLRSSSSVLVVNRHCCVSRFFYSSSTQVRKDEREREATHTRQNKVITDGHHTHTHSIHIYIMMFTRLSSCSSSLRSSSSVLVVHRRCVSRFFCSSTQVRKALSSREELGRTTTTIRELKSYSVLSLRPVLLNRWCAVSRFFSSTSTQVKKISAHAVKELRSMTGAGILECKKALSEIEDSEDLDSAVEWLRKNGLAKAAKKAGRETSMGLVGVKMDGGRAAVVEINSETDFVSRTFFFSFFLKIANTHTLVFNIT